MLIPVIEFEMRNPVNGQFEEYAVLNTDNNQELVMNDRRTRAIQFRHMFDFQFERTTAPKFIQFGNAVLDSLKDCLDDSYITDSEYGVDYGDQMA